MRKVVLLNQNWSFCPPDGETFTQVNIPHTWNGEDGQDGDAKYVRGVGTYRKVFEIANVEDNRVFIEFQAVANIADVYVNDTFVGHHEGGYSCFRFDITEMIHQGENEIEVKVDNSKNHVYPQVADFTFYGGIYRDVHLIIVPQIHFELLDHGTPGIKVTSLVKGNDAVVIVETWQNDGLVNVTVGQETKQVKSDNGYAKVEFEIKDVHLWDGLEDPFLYKATATIIVDNKEVDEISTMFGCRTFEIDSHKGFLLNGRSYPLRGVSRHQDRPKIGNALTKQMHEEDMKLIYEMGANSVRLAHYQHDQYIYDLCDQLGLIVWAEIPYISAHMNEGNENTISQMKDLITQNYNHPSIAVWGLSNEITMQGNSDDLYNQHMILNHLVHDMDATRKTVMANVSMLSTSDRLIDLPDVLAYNLYFGWYLGELKDNDAFFDKFHKEHPTRAIGLSEYGCDTNIHFHTSNPTRGDYSEEYQLMYHKHILRMLEDRPWMWCSYAWNMFDFAADARNESGAKGLNQKGLVSFDRKTPKDVYYLYQANWSKKPMLYIAGRRYVDRNEKETDICVYTNEKEVTLFIDGQELETKIADKEVHFTVSLNNRHHIVAKSSTLMDEITIQYVDKQNEAYIYKGAGILNWFDADGLKKDYYSLEDSVASIASVKEAEGILNRIVNTVAEGDKELLQKARENHDFLFTLKDVSLLDFLDQSGNPISNNIKRMINSQLQQIRKKDIS